MLIAGKWKLEILWLLHHRIHRFGELKRSIPGMSQHMLTLQLRELEEDGLITRTVYAEVPPRVEYAMTDATKALEPTIASLLRWWREHGKDAGKDKKKRQPNRPRQSRSEEHTSELQSLMRNSYAVFCLNKKKHNQHHYSYNTHTPY